jgi:hypothetical protein
MGKHEAGHEKDFPRRGCVVQRAWQPPGFHP